MARFCTLIFVIFVQHCISRYQYSNVKLRNQNEQEVASGARLRFGVNLMSTIDSLTSVSYWCYIDDYRQSSTYHTLFTTLTPLKSAGSSFGRKMTDSE
jgi:hypothetical protein